MNVTGCPILQQNTTNTNSSGITLNGNWCLGMEIFESHCICDMKLHLPKFSIMCCIPCEFCVFPIECTSDMIESVASLMSNVHITPRFNMQSISFLSASTIALGIFLGGCTTDGMLGSTSSFTLAPWMVLTLSNKSG